MSKYKKTDEFLNKLKQLLAEYDAEITRSNNGGNDLLIIVRLGPNNFDELLFAENIDETQIKNEWYSR